MPLWPNGNTTLNSHDFTSLLQHPQGINAQKTDALASVIKTYPYFQAAKALHLKGLRQQESSVYNKHLKITAAYTTDRSILFDFITSDVFIQNEISKAIKQNSAHLNDIDVTVSDISVNKKQTIDDTLKQHIKDTTGVLDPELFQPKLKEPKTSIAPVPNETQNLEHNTSNKDSTETQETAATILNLGKPLTFQKQETHSFNEWLKLTRVQPVKRNPDAPSTSPIATKVVEKSKHDEIIDKFIAQNPRIKPVKSTVQKGNLTQTNLSVQEGLMTETLARIFVEQKNYKKAIQSYKILSLKYPEKSSFFANQIKAVEQLQEQNK